VVVCSEHIALSKISSFAERSDISVNYITVLNDRVHEMLNRGEDVVCFHSGEVGYSTPQHIKDAAYDWLNEGYTHYAPTTGYRELKTAIAVKLAARNGIEADPDTEILVTQGAAEAIYATLMAILNPGDEFLMTDPCYPSYESCVKMAEGVPELIPTTEENEWKAHSAEIEERVTDRTKGIIVNSPNNPTGEMLDKADLDDLSQIAHQHDIWVVSDEAYEEIVFDGRRHYSIGSFSDMKDRTISIFTFSKTFAMTGWRLGYIVGPKKFIEHANVIHQAVLEHVTSHVQMAGCAALRGPQHQISDMVADLNHRRKQLVEGLNRIHGINCKMPKGAFYAFADIKELGITSAQFSERLLSEAKVSATPGTAFGRCGEGYVRLAYSQTSNEQITKGLERMTNLFGRK
jgi:aspartate/methionine/tyrosine aminotransferase